MGAELECDPATMRAPNTGRSDRAQARRTTPIRAARTDPTDWQHRAWQTSRRITTPLASTPPAFVAVIPEGRVVGTDGAVVAPDDALLGDVSVDLGVVNTGEAQGHSIRRTWHLPPVKRLRAGVAVLSVLGGHNYFHWMFHLLPASSCCAEPGLSRPSTGFSRTSCTPPSRARRSRSWACLGIVSFKLARART